MNMGKSMFKDQLEAIEVARSWVNNPTDLRIIDTETTGLDKNAEIVEISIIDGNGKVLMDTLIKPTKPIPQSAIDIHGITNEMLENEKPWAEYAEQFEAIVYGRDLVIYNSDYDLRLIRQTYKANNIELAREVQESYSVGCAMLTYSAFMGVWDDYRENWKWHKLVDAAENSGVDNDGAHRALSDVIMTLGVIKHIASQKGREQYE